MAEDTWPYYDKINLLGDLRNWVLNLPMVQIIRVWFIFAYLYLIASNNGPNDIMLIFNSTYLVSIHFYIR